MRDHFDTQIPSEKNQLDNLESSIEPTKKRERQVRTQASTQAEAERRAGLNTLGPDLKTAHADQLAEEAVEQFKQGETEIVTNEMRDRLAKGEGLELILQYGWKRFRNIARNSELGNIYEQQIKEIEADLVALEKLPPLTEADKREIAHLMEVKRRQMSLEALGIEDEHGVDAENPKVPKELPIETTLKAKHPETWRDGWRIKHKENKIWVDRNAYDYPKLQSNPLTRFYISPPLGETYKVFDKLIGALKDFKLHSDFHHDSTGQIFGSVELGLELSGVLYPESKLYTGNTIILYVENRKKGWTDDYQSDVNAEIKQEIARALRQALTPKSTDAHPFDYLGKYRDWAMIKYRAMSKASALLDLTLPLAQDRMVKMVEQEHGDSYHKGDLPKLVEDMNLPFQGSHSYEVLRHPFLTGSYDADINIEQLKILAAALNGFEPNNYPNFAKHKRYPNMPSLLTDEAYADDRSKSWW